MGRVLLGVFPQDGQAPLISPYPVISAWGMFWQSSHLCQCLLSDFLREINELLEARPPGLRYSSATAQRLFSGSPCPPVQWLWPFTLWPFRVLCWVSPFQQPEVIVVGTDTPVHVLPILCY